MKIVVDTNIVFSALINTNSHIGVNLTSDVDADDIAFVALTLHLDAQLWTGDKRLIRGLAAKGFDRVVTTQDIIDLRDI